MLLRCRNESRRLFGDRLPTRFSFEVCPTDLRAQRAQTLIAQYHPMAPAPQSLALAAPLNPKDKRLRDSKAHVAPGSNATPPEWPAPDVEHDLALGNKRYFMSRQQLATLGVVFVVTLLTVGYLGFFAGQRIGARRNLAIQLAVAKMAKAPVDRDEQPTFSSIAGDELSSHEAISTDSQAMIREQPTKDESPRRPINSQDLASTAAITDASPKLENKSAATDPNRPVQGTPPVQEQPLSPPAKLEAPSNSWSVQVISTQDQPAAQLLLGQLKGKGYDAYIVEAEINSNRWFRVRVGPLQSRQEANLLRETLATKERLAAAFVVGK
jgi:cell division septation protein DedD